MSNHGAGWDAEIQLWNSTMDLLSEICQREAGLCYLQLQVSSTLKFGTKGKMSLFLAFLAFSQQWPVARFRRKLWLMGEYVIGKISCCFLMSNSHCLWRLYPKVLLGINKWVSFLGHVDAYEMDSSMWNHFMLIKCWFDICIQRYISRASQMIRIHKGSLLTGENNGFQGSGLLWVEIHVSPGWSSWCHWKWVFLDPCCG